MKSNRYFLTRAMLIFLLFCLSFSETFAQSPQTINYQAVARSSSGTIMANQGVSVQIRILQGSSSGTEVCSETFAVTTNDFGLINIQIGSQNPVSFSSINWGIDSYWIEVSLNGNLFGVSQLISVPYALHSNTADSLVNFSESELENIFPAGMIIPFAGDTNHIPAGWLLCDGSAVSRITYARLYAAIDTIWGLGDSVSTFNLPDFRGTFLRGTDLGAGNDPDAAIRSASNGGNAGDKVGSVQGDSFQGHYHKYTGSDVNNNPGNVRLNTGAYGNYPNISGGINEPVNDGVNGTPRTSSETRPKNKNVHYIIKF